MKKLLQCLALLSLSVTNVAIATTSVEAQKQTETLLASETTNNNINLDQVNKANNNEHVVLVSAIQS